MASVPPKKNTAYTFDVVLIDRATGQIKVTPTLATGDVKISKDGGATANLGTLPAETPAGSGIIAVVLTGTEMTADRVTILFRDAAGAEWNDLACHIETSVRQTDDLATQTSVDDLPTNAELATALGTADDAVLAAIAALNNLSAAQVNAEVVDALATDTYAEPGQGAPAATASLSAKIGYLYKAWRNKKTVTATTFSLFADDAATVDQKSTISDDATTFTETEKATGP